MRYMYNCDKVFKVHIYSLSCKILPIASVMVTDRFLHRECNLWGQYIIQVHPPRNLPSGTWVHIFRVLVVRSLPIASVSSVYQGIDLQYKKHEYGQTLVEYAITCRVPPAAASCSPQFCHSAGPLDWRPLDEKTKMTMKKKRGGKKAH